MSLRMRIHNALLPVRSIMRSRRLPLAARNEEQIDSLGLPQNEPGIDQSIREAAAWLGRAQDCSLSADGGVARHYSLLTGWSTSYPETTGYIIPTILACAREFGDGVIRKRAERMLDWLVSIQFPDGGFQGGSISGRRRVPVTFNTGQILLGLASGVLELGKYYEPMCLAADWLVATQDSDGCWRKFSTPFAEPGEKAYETHVAWGLFEAARIEPNRGYALAGSANIKWALRLQQDNGWFAKCCLTDPSMPLTHTIGYVLRGIIEAYRFTGEDELLQAARRTADGILTAVQADGFLPGRLAPDWSGTVSWACLTGSVQIAHCWLMLYQLTGEAKYRDTAFSVNRYVRRTMKVTGPPEMSGGIKGSFPINGAYNPFQYLNWACKFFIDSNLLEKEVREEG